MTDKTAEMATGPVSDIKGLHNIVTYAGNRRARIREQVVKSMENVFKVEGTNHDVSVSDVRVEEKDFTHMDMKDALMGQKTLLEPVKGTIYIKDKNGKVVDKSRRVLAHVPWMTDRHTFVVDGNEYGLASQQRIKPGVYTRERANGELEAAFNLGRGKNFRISMDPLKGVFYIGYDSTKIVLYPVLRALGTQDSDMERAWGKRLLAVNQTAVKSGLLQVKKLYQKVVHPKQQEEGATQEQMAQAISSAYDRTVLDPSVTNITLGAKHPLVSRKALLDASKKLVRVYRREEEEDDRDSLAFKTIHTPDTFFKERIEKNAAPQLMYKIRSKLNRTSAPTVGDVVPNSPFTKSIRSLVTTSQVSYAPSQINPVEIQDLAAKLTSLGEGGISTLRAVPDSTREQHGSQLGIVDPIRTPDSGTVGVDLRATVRAAVDENGDPHAMMIDVKTGQRKYVSAAELQTKKVAFVGTDLKKNRMVPALVGNKVRDVKSSEVDYIVPTVNSTLSPATMLVPLLNGMQGNRSLMGAKMQTQAVPLRHREAPLVQTEGPRDALGNVGSAETALARQHLPVSPVAGTVKKIDKAKGVVVISPRGGGKDVKVPFAEGVPFASKTGLTHTLSVKVGDRVKKKQVLGDSNFTRNGTYALGTNLKTAYISYLGKTTNDAVVISEAASEKLISEHMYRETQTISDTTKLSKALHRRYFGTKVSPGNYEKFEESGVPKVGSVIHSGERLTLAVAEKKFSADDAMLGRLKKSLVAPYRDVSLTWEHSHPGTVTEVRATPKHVTMLVTTAEKMSVGDKVANRFGGKGVVGLILPNDQMPQDESGEPIDIMLTSAGVVSRVNPNQIIETAVGKVAKELGRPFILDQAPRKDRVKWVKDLLKKHKVKDKETLTDPTTGKKIPGIFTGQSYMFKLFKSTDTNFSTRAVGPYDSNEQPTKGGTEGAKAAGRMELNALLAHGAKALARETATVKGTKNDEFWKRVQMGMPESHGQVPFSFRKFGAMLTGSGINFRKQGSQFHVSPLTDRDIDKMAKDEISKAGVVKVRATKTAVRVVPETGGLFDPAKTGGMRGTKWSKIKLAEPVVNPLFEKPARELLGMSEREFNTEYETQGGKAMRKRLNAIDTKGLLSSLKRSIRGGLKDPSKSKLDGVDRDVRKIKYLHALERSKLKPGDAYVLSKVPVVPPVMRPVSSGGDGQVLISDPNFLYKDLLLVNNAIRDTPAALREIEDPADSRRELQGAVRAVFGTGDPVNEKTKARGALGFMSQIAGQTSPKQGFFHKRLLTRQQDLSGRGTIAPDPALGLDEIGVPDAMLWKQYGPFIVRRLLQKGYQVTRAREMVENKDPAARRELELETKQRPMYLNRAPTLHRYSMMAAYPKSVHGKTIRLNPFAEEGMNADYDGDAIQLHVPATAAGLEDAKKMTMSSMIFDDGERDSLLVRPHHEAVVGTFLATGAPKGALQKFKTKGDALQAYHRGAITMNTPVTIAGK